VLAPISRIGANTLHQIDIWVNLPQFTHPITMNYQLFARFAIACGAITLVIQPGKSIAATAITPPAVELSVNTIARGWFKPRSGTVKIAKPIVRKGGAKLQKALKGYRIKRYRIGDQHLVIEGQLKNYINHFVPKLGKK
jgi:hypothetical protein